MFRLREATFHITVKTELTSEITAQEDKLIY